MNFLLDAGVLIGLAGEPDRAREIWRGEKTVEEGRCAISVISMDELLRSCHQEKEEVSRARRMAVIGALADRFEILPVDEQVIRVHAVLRGGMKKSRAGLGHNEGWIAATCLAHSFTLVTNRPGIFRKIGKLPLQNFLI